MATHQLLRGKARLGSLTIGGSGTLVKKLVTSTVSLNPASIASVTRVGTTFTVTGAATGDVLIAQPPATLNDDLVYVGCAITAANTGTIYLYNPTGGAIDDGALNWIVTWIDVT